MAVNSAAKAAMQKGRVEKAKSKKAKKEAARARAAVAREARFGKKGDAAKATPKKWGGCDGRAGEDGDTQWYTFLFYTRWCLRILCITFEYSVANVTFFKRSLEVTTTILLAERYLVAQSDLA